MDIFDSRLARPMRHGCGLLPFDSDEHLFELRLAGERCLAYLDDDAELVNARGRRLLPQFPELTRLHRRVGRRCILDGVLALGGGEDDREGLAERLRCVDPFRVARLAARRPAMFVAVDILYLDRAPVVRLPLATRRDLLLSLVRDGDILCPVRSVERRGIDFHRLVQARSLSGVIAKRRDSPYRMGESSRDWVRFRNWQESSFVICGYTPGDGPDDASLILGQYDGAGDIVYKGRVRLRADSPELAVIENQPPAFRSPFRELDRDRPGAVWLQPRLVCEIGLAGWSDDKRPRDPFFLRLAPDNLPYAAAEPA